MTFSPPPRLVFLDVEAAGVQVFRPLIQVAAIAVDERLQELDVFEAKIQFQERDATRRTFRRRHYRRAVWDREARPARDVAADLSDFLRRHATLTVASAGGSRDRIAQLVAHHAAFDGPLLRAWFERQRVRLPASYRMLCTMHRAMWFFQEHPGLPPPKDYQLGTLCRYFDVPWSPRHAHEALADARATVRLYRSMMDHQQRSGTWPEAIGRGAA